jgi:plasmid maintenance system antidote protein VapI
MEKNTTKTITVMKPHRLLDHVIVAYKLKSDRQLAQHIGVAPSTICKVRSRALPLSADVMVKIHDYTKMPFESIREMAK